MTEPLTFTIERDVDPDDRRWPHRLVWSSDPAAAWLTTAQADHLEALQARAAQPQVKTPERLTAKTAAEHPWAGCEFSSMAEAIACAWNGAIHEVIALNDHPMSLVAPEANAAEPQGDYAALRAAVEALRDEWRYSTRDEPYAEALTAILIAHPPLSLPDGFALTPTADAAAAVAAVRTGKWTAHWPGGAEVYDRTLAEYAEDCPKGRFHMRPVSPPMVRVEIELPADASDDEIVAAFRAQGGA